MDETTQAPEGAREDLADFWPDLIGDNGVRGRFQDFDGTRVALVMVPIDRDISTIELEEQFVSQHEGQIYCFMPVIPGEETNPDNENPATWGGDVFIQVNIGRSALGIQAFRYYQFIAERNIRGRIWLVDEVPQPGRRPERERANPLFRGLRRRPRPTPPPPVTGDEFADDIGPTLEGGDVLNIPEEYEEEEFCPVTMATYLRDDRQELEAVCERPFHICNLECQDRCVAYADYYDRVDRIAQVLCPYPEQEHENGHPDLYLSFIEETEGIPHGIDIRPDLEESTRVLEAARPDRRIGYMCAYRRHIGLVRLFVILRVLEEGNEDAARALVNSWRRGTNIQADPIEEEPQTPGYVDPPPHVTRFPDINADPAPNVTLNVPPAVVIDEVGPAPTTMNVAAVNQVNPPPPSLYEIARARLDELDDELGSLCSDMMEDVARCFTGQYCDQNHQDCPGLQGYVNALQGAADDFWQGTDQEAIDLPARGIIVLREGGLEAHVDGVYNRLNQITPRLCPRAETAHLWGQRCFEECNTAYGNCTEFSEYLKWCKIAQGLLEMDAILGNNSVTARSQSGGGFKGFLKGWVQKSRQS